MAEQFGAAFDAIRDVAGTASDIFNTLDTVKDICDGACVALGAASIIPGAAAVTGPVIATYQSIRPPLSTVITVGGTVVQFLSLACTLIDGLDDALSGDYNSFINEASGLAQSAFAN